MTDEEQGSESFEDWEYLRDLSERIWLIPPMHGVDQYDYERLREIADSIQKQEK